jgi:hypothetical protein
LTEIDERMGWWIRMTAADALEVSGTVPEEVTIPLCMGSNLVGYPSLQSQAIEDALASMAGMYTLIHAYDAADTADSWKKYDPSAPPFANDLLEMRPKLGYWITLNQPNADWTINN